MGDMVYEFVPRLSKRAGDAVFANSNNSTLILGRDRAGSIESGHGNESSAAAAHLVVGRKSSDPSIIDDRATLYLSQKSDPDDMGATGQIGRTSTGVSSAMLRADCLRLHGRNDMKLTVGSAYILLDGDKIVLEGNIELGAGAVDSIIKGQTFGAFYSSHTHISPSTGGPTSAPVVPLPDSVYSKKARIG